MHTGRGVGGSSERGGSRTVGKIEVNGRSKGSEGRSEGSGGGGSSCGDCV